MCGPGESGSQTLWGYFFAGQLGPAISYLERGNSSSSSVSPPPLDWQLSTTMPSNVRVCLRKSTALTRTSPEWAHAGIYKTHAWLSPGAV